MGKEPQVSFAEKVETSLSIRCPDEAVFRTFAVAHVEHFTAPAVCGERVAFGTSEGPLLRAFHHLDKRCLNQIADAVLFVHVVIARVKIPVVFDDWNVPAGFPEDAEGMLLSEGSGRDAAFGDFFPPVRIGSDEREETDIICSDLPEE